MAQSDSHDAHAIVIRKNWRVRIFTGSFIDFFLALLFLMIFFLGFILVKSLTGLEIGDAISADFQTASAHANAQIQDAIAQTRSCALEKFNQRLGFNETNDWRRTVWIPCAQQGESLLHENAANLADLRERLAPIESHWIQLLFPSKEKTKAPSA